MIWSEKCDNPEAGFNVNPETRQATCKAQGFWVFSEEEVNIIMNYKRDNNMCDLTLEQAKEIIKSKLGGI